MRKIILAAALLSTLAVAAPASAQYRGDRDRGPGYGQDYRDGRIDQQLGQLTDRVRMLRDRRQLSRSEAERLLYRINAVGRLEHRYARDGLSRWERQDLQRRVQSVRAELRYERNDRDPRYDRDDRYDRGDRDGRDDRYRR